MSNTTSQGLAPFVAMETPIGSGAAPIFVFLYITLCQMVLFVGDLPVPTVFAWVDGRVHMHVFVTDREWERKEERDQNKVGGIERMKGKMGGGMTRKGMNDGDNKWKTHKKACIQRTHIRQQG